MCKCAASIEKAAIIQQNRENLIKVRYIGNTIKWYKGLSSHATYRKISPNQVFYVLNVDQLADIVELEVVP